MDFHYIEKLKKTHPSLKLVLADSAPLVISFFEREFIEKNIRSIAESLLVEKLRDHLLYIHRIIGDEIFTRTAEEYLEDWSGNEKGWLRKYYPKIGDEPEFDITPAAEKVVEWFRSFETKEFVGTESRLLLIFQMIKDLSSSVETDPELKLQELELQKAEIEKEIALVKTGVVESYDERLIRENIWRIEEEIRSLMSDFRQVEENFRKLNRQTRENIASSDSDKSEILDNIFLEHDSIAKSEQGKSFSAFWQFIMSPSKNIEIEKNIKKINENIDNCNDQNSRYLKSFKINLLDAGEKVQNTLSDLNEQLRLFLDEKVRLENKRIMELIKETEKLALNVRNNPPKDKKFFEINSTSPSINLVMEKNTFTRPVKPAVFDDDILAGKAESIPDLLRNIYYVDEEKLKDNIKRSLSERNQITLKELCYEFPVEKGISEIITYITLASKDENCIIDSDNEEEIYYNENELEKLINAPLVIFRND